MALPPISSSTNPPLYTATLVDSHRNRPTLAPTVPEGDAGRPSMPTVGTGRLPTHSGPLPRANADGVVTTGGRVRGVTGYVGNFFSSMFSSGRSGRS